MRRQLTLLEEPADWRFTEETKRIGLEGLARARAALRDGERNPDRSGREELPESADSNGDDHTPRAA